MPAGSDDERLDARDASEDNTVRPSLEDADGSRYGDTVASGVGAPHIGRMAHAYDAERWPGAIGRSDRKSEEGRRKQGAGWPGEHCQAGELGDTKHGGCEARQPEWRGAGATLPSSHTGILEHAESDGREPRRAESGRRGTIGGCGESPWSNAAWLPCKDGKLRAVESVPESLADGVADLLGSVRYQGGRIFHPLQVKAPARRLRLHGHGDAIVSRVAAEFIKASMEVIR